MKCEASIFSHRQPSAQRQRSPKRHNTTTLALRLAAPHRSLRFGARSAPGCWLWLRFLCLMNCSGVCIGVGRVDCNLIRCEPYSAQLFSLSFVASLWFRDCGILIWYGIMFIPKRLYVRIYLKFMQVSATNVTTKAIWDVQTYPLVRESLPFHVSRFQMTFQIFTTLNYIDIMFNKLIVQINH